MPRTRRSALIAFVLTRPRGALTSFYSWRLMFLTFEGKPREQPERAGSRP